MTKLKPIHYININNSMLYLVSDIVYTFSLDYDLVIRKISPNYVQIKMSSFEENRLYVSAENLYGIKDDFNNDSFVKFVQCINHIMSEDVFNIAEQTINLYV